MQARPDRYYPILGWIWITIAALYTLMALLSAMETPERYYIHLAVWVLVAATLAVGGFGALNGLAWGEKTIIATAILQSVFWALTTVWLSAAIESEFLYVILVISALFAVVAIYVTRKALSVTKDNAA